MTLGWPRPRTPHGLTCTLITLRKYVQEYVLDINRGREKFIVESLVDYDSNTGEPIEATPCDPTTDTLSRLMALEATLNALENKLRAYDLWSYPDEEIYQPTPPLLVFSKLERQVTILDHIIADTQSPEPPDAHSHLSLYEWKWDPSWREFYTESDITKNRMYLTFWQIISPGMPLDHLVQARNTNMTPELAAEWLGPWDQWKWDRLRGEWFIQMSADFIGVECLCYAAWWRGAGNWGADWELLGGIGEIW